MKFCTLSSGSSGNCAVVSCGDTHILIDAGISMRRTVASLKALDISPDDISGVFITHGHSDHISSLAMLVKYFNFTVYSPENTAFDLCRTCPSLYSNIISFSPGDSLSVGAAELKSFPTPHDCPDSVGYRISCEGRSLAFVTDLGRVTDEVLSAVRGVDSAVIESNHDVDMLRFGAYPQQLKRRILGDRGHLSNEAASAFAAELLESGTRRIVLAHLSRENNRPELAFSVTEARLRSCGAEPGRDFELFVAPRSAAGAYRSV